MSAADTTQIAKLLGTLDSELPRDLQEALGLWTSQGRLDAIAGELDVAVVESLSAQLRKVAEVARLADRRSAANEQGLHRLQWLLEDMVAETLHEDVSTDYAEAETSPPTREHVRRAVSEVIDASKESTTPEEDDLLLRVLIASLSPQGAKDAAGARLRRLVTSRRIGPPEVRRLRTLSEQNRATNVELGKPSRIGELFALASADPPLVTIYAGPGTNYPGAYVTRLDQVQSTSRRLEVAVTEDGRHLLELLDVAGEILERSKTV